LSYTIYSVSEDFPGISDFEVIEKAIKIGAIILTFDKDYGEILFKNQQWLGKVSVVFFRFKGFEPEYAGKRFAQLCEAGIMWEGNFSVIEENYLRQRKLY
ncbi:MAG: DUF5615 family PIN-like protein, partial [Flavobacteriales bacterium]